MEPACEWAAGSRKQALLTEPLGPPGQGRAILGSSRRASSRWADVEQTRTPAGATAGRPLPRQSLQGITRMNSSSPLAEGCSAPEALQRFSKRCAVDGQVSTQLAERGILETHLQQVFHIELGMAPAAGLAWPEKQQGPGRLLKRSGVAGQRCPGRLERPPGYGFETLRPLHPAPVCAGSFHACSHLGSSIEAITVLPCFIRAGWPHHLFRPLVADGGRRWPGDVFNADGPMWPISRHRGR